MMHYGEGCVRPGCLGKFTAGPRRFRRDPGCSLEPPLMVRRLVCSDPRCGWVTFEYKRRDGKRRDGGGRI